MKYTPTLPAQALAWPKAYLLKNLDPLPHPRDRTIYLVFGAFLLMFALFTLGTLSAIPLLFLMAAGLFLIRCAVEVVTESPVSAPQQTIEPSAQMVSMQEFTTQLLDSNASCVVFVDSSESEESEESTDKPDTPSEVH